MRQPPSVRPLSTHHQDKLADFNSCMRSSVSICELPVMTCEDELKFLRSIWIQQSKGTPGDFYSRMSKNTRRSHHVNERYHPFFSCLSNERVYCCTFMFDQYTVTKAEWSLNAPTCTLLSSVKQLKQLRWRKFCCKHITGRRQTKLYSRWNHLGALLSMPAGPSGSVMARMRTSFPPHSPHRFLTWLVTVCLP